MHELPVMLEGGSCRYTGLVKVWVVYPLHGEVAVTVMEPVALPEKVE